MSRPLRRQTIPRSLRVTPNRTFRKIRRLAERKTDQQSILKSGMIRNRGYRFVDSMLQIMGEEGLDKLIFDVLSRKERCVFLELGNGNGELAVGIANCLQYENSPLHHMDGRRIKYVGIDLASGGPHSSPGSLPSGAISVEQRKEDLLLHAFPHADIITSAWVFGYAGHIGFALKKVARSLFPGGIAIIHINQAVNHSLKKGIKNIDALKKNIERMRFGDGFQLNIHQLSGKDRGFNSGDILLTIRRG